MRIDKQQRLANLSLRERDCIDLLSKGFSASGVAAELGIAKSTVEKHLSSAREKLGVHRTIEVILAYRQLASLSKSVQADNHQLLDMESSPSDTAIALNHAVSSCATFGEAWQHMNTCINRFGIRASMMGVVTEPAGMLTNGAKLLKSSFSDEVMQLYELTGGVSADPVPKRITVDRSPFLIDISELNRNRLKNLPRSLINLSEAFLDHELSSMLVIPALDESTNAPYSMSFCLEPVTRSDARELIPELSSITTQFWNTAKQQKLLSREAGLTDKQTQSLSYAARGFSNRDIAEHMNVSLRSAEKTLSNARRKLGARTTTAAVYRAMVFGAL